MYSKVKIAWHPVHPMPVAFPVACYTGLVGFAAYAANGHLFWLNPAIALSVAGTGTAVLAALADLGGWALGFPRDLAAKMTGLLHTGVIGPCQRGQGDPPAGQVAAYRFRSS